LRRAGLVSVCIWARPPARPDTGWRQMKTKGLKGSPSVRSSRRRRRKLSVPKVVRPRRRQRRVWQASGPPTPAPSGRRLGGYYYQQWPAGSPPAGWVLTRQFFSGSINFSHCTEDSACHGLMVRWSVLLLFF